MIIKTQGKNALRRALKPFLSQVSAKVCFHMIYSFGVVVDVLLSPAGLRRNRTDKTAKSLVKLRWFTIFTAPGLLWMFPVRDAGEHLQLCSLLFSFLFFTLFIQGGFAENTSFSAWTEIQAAINVPLSSQTGSKPWYTICIFLHIFFYIINIIYSTDCSCKCLMGLRVSFP